MIVEPGHGFTTIGACCLSKYFAKTCILSGLLTFGCRMMPALNLWLSLRSNIFKTRAGNWKTVEEYKRFEDQIQVRKNQQVKYKNARNTDLGQKSFSESVSYGDGMIRSWFSSNLYISLHGPRGTHFSTFILWCPKNLLELTIGRLLYI